MKTFFLSSIFLLSACLLVWSDFVFELRLPFHDTMVINYPWREFLSDCVRRNVIPLWDSWNSPGFPITFFNAPLWNPIAYLFGLFKEYEISLLMAEIYFLSFTSAVGCYFWLRKQEISMLFALCGAVVWMSSGPFLTSVQGLAIFTTISFIPWIFLSVTLIIESTNRQDCLLGILVASMSIWFMVTGGYVGLSIPVLFFVLIYALFLFCRNYRKAPRILAVTLGAGCIILFLIAGPIADYLYIKDYMLELRGLAEGGYDPFTNSLALNSVWTLLLGNGGYLENITVGRADQLYMGTALFLLIPGCILVTRLKGKDIFFLALAVFVFLSAMGPESPVARFIVNTVPLMSLFRHHVFWSPLIVFSLITLSLRLVCRVVLDKQIDVSPVNIFRFYMLCIGIFAVWIVYFCQNGSYKHEPFVFSLFEIIGYLISIVFFIGFLFFVIINSRLYHKYLNCAFSLLGAIAIVSAGYLAFIYGNDIFSFYMRIFDGEGGRVKEAGLSVMDKLLVQRIVLSPNAMLFQDLFYMGTVASVLLIIISNYARNRKKYWIYLLLFLIVADMVFASHRYFIGNNQYLGTPPDFKEHVFLKKDIDVSQLVKASDFYCNIVPTKSTVLKGDVINFRIKMKDVDQSMTLSIIIYRTDRKERVIEKQFSSTDFNKQNEIVFSGTAQSSLSNYLFEIRYYGIESLPQPLSASLSIARTVPAKSNIDPSVRTIEYTGNTRIAGDYDKPQFYRNRTPVESTYMPLFNPRIKQLAAEPHGKTIFSKLLWTMPANIDADINAWPEIAKEPKLKSSTMSSNTLLVDVVAEEPSRLIWADAWDSGWSATVNGQHVVIDKIFDSIKSVNIPEGQAVVKFVYQRKDRTIAVALTFIGVAILIVLLFFILSEKSTRSKDQSIPA